MARNPARPMMTPRLLATWECSMPGKRTSLILMTLIALACAPALWAGPEQGCGDCHGKDGASTESDVPVIGGQSAAYLQDQLGEYRDGARPCPESKYRAGDKSRPATDMCKLAKALTEPDLAAVSGYFA